MVAPCGDLLQRGVRVVPQLLHLCQLKKQTVEFLQAYLQTWPPCPGVMLASGAAPGLRLFRDGSASPLGLVLEPPGDSAPCVEPHGFDSCGDGECVELDDLEGTGRDGKAVLVVPVSCCEPGVAAVG
jgi:hypothetical protein